MLILRQTVYKSGSVSNHVKSLMLVTQVMSPLYTLSQGNHSFMALLLIDINPIISYTPAHIAAVLWNEPLSLSLG